MNKIKGRQEQTNMRLTFDDEGGGVGGGAGGVGSLASVVSTVMGVSVREEKRAGELV